jgi:hypothetical protein
MISKGQIHDAAIEQHRMEEDEKYEAILAAREREEEQKRQIRTAEEAELRKEEKRLYDEEQVSAFRPIRHGKADFPGTSAEMDADSATSTTC